MGMSNYGGATHHIQESEHEDISSIASKTRQSFILEGGDRPSGNYGMGKGAAYTDESPFKEDGGHDIDDSLRVSKSSDRYAGLNDRSPNPISQAILGKTPEEPHRQGISETTL
jgi:hypothetical protein